MKPKWYKITDFMPPIDMTDKSGVTSEWVIIKILGTEIEAYCDYKTGVFDSGYYNIAYKIHEVECWRFRD